MYIFKLSGEYIGFIENANFYSADGGYLGWTENGHAWDREGNYRGEIKMINGSNYILKDTSLVDPPARPRRVEEPAKQIQPQLKIAPVQVEFNLRDGF